MSIWDYEDQLEKDDKTLIADGLKLKSCLFCNARMKALSHKRVGPHRISSNFRFKHLGSASSSLIRVCPICGWWQAHETQNRFDMTARHASGYNLELGGIGRLRNLDLTDISIPIQEIRDFLTVKYERRNDLHPRVMEETVGSVFRDSGYRARVTAYTGDGGIDVVLDGSNHTRIGVQVKRSKNSVEVEQIRAFTGALVLGGYTKGIFVTTSRFQSGAIETAKRAGLSGIAIELVDAKRFYDALKLAQRNVYRSSEDFLRGAGSRRLIVLSERGTPPRPRRRAKVA